jgi:hypothetical protein
MPIAGRVAVCAVLCCSAIAAACSGRVLKPQYEYEEELYLDLDGSATLNVNASIAALVALRGVDLPTDPLARLDRDRVRALFTRPGSNVALSVSRREGRRFVHISVQVDDVRDLARLQPFAWSTYTFDRDGERADYHQVVGPASRRDVGQVGWNGDELIVFRVHVPSEVLFENSATEVRRGNILEWEQPLTSRLRGDPLELRVQMGTESILHNTLLLFGSTIVAAAAAFAAVLWWVARRGRQPEAMESRA